MDIFTKKENIFLFLENSSQEQLIEMYLILLLSFYYFIFTLKFCF